MHELGPLIGNTAWAFAKSGHSDELLFFALARAVVLRMGEFNAQELEMALSFVS